MLYRLTFAFSVVMAMAVVWPAPAVAVEPKQWVAENLPSLVKLYRHLHRNAELSFEEEKTAGRLARELKSVGAEVTTGVGGHGVVGLLKNGNGPTLMIRTDMDGLPVTERTGLTYASTITVKDEKDNTVGVMHACGHDIHMTSLVAVARYLAANRDRWRGTVMFLCQPAEERGAGAKAMLDDGLFERFPKPDFGIALHVDGSLATGKVGYRAGFSLANVDAVDVRMNGRGGHGAYPHTTIDPIVQAAQFIVGLQTIVSREISPTDPAVITVGAIHGGTKHNVIPDFCDLKITVRSYTDEVRQHLLSAIERKAKAIAQGAGAPEPVVKVSESTPALFNDENLAERLGPVFQQALGDENVVTTKAVMGGEDFSRYGRSGVPILMYRLGSVNEQRLEGFTRIGKTPPSLHSALYYPDPEETLTTGLVVMASAAMSLLPPGE